MMIAVYNGVISQEWVIPIQIYTFKVRCVYTQTQISGIGIECGSILIQF